jgi:hypothetical protein
VQEIFSLHNYLMRLEVLHHPQLLYAEQQRKRRRGTFVIPFTTPTGAGYRVRVVASNPTFTSQSNGVDLRINGLTINTPTTTSLVYCQGEVFNLTYSQNCNFSNTG